MNEILNFLIKPTKMVKKLSSKKDNSKIITIGILLLIYSLSSVGSTYFGIFGELYNTYYYGILFFYNILSLIIISFIIWQVGKVFGGKARYIDVLLVITLANIVWIIANVSFIAISFIKPIFLLSLISTISIISVAWFVTLLGKGLIKIENISEKKITFIVFFSLIILYFVNLFVFGVNGI